MMEPKDIDNLIAKVLTGEASQQELLEMDAWKKAAAKNQTYFEDSKSIFERIAGLKEEIPVNTELAWKELETRLNTPAGKIMPLFGRTRVLRAAASIFLLVSLGFLMNWLFSPSSIETIQLETANKSKEKRLPDGSKVLLDKNSSLTYALTKKNVRKVNLRGVAHFEVVHNEEKPFVIEMNDVFIKDIGTAFEVKAKPESDLIEVSVDEGEVHFYTETNTGLRLVKGEKASYNKLSKAFIKLSPSANDNTYNSLTRQFNFENTPLLDVVEQLNAAYNSNIRLENSKIGACRLSVSFNNEKLNLLLAVIAETLNLKLIQQDSTIILQGDGCLR